MGFKRAKDFQPQTLLTPTTNVGRGSRGADRTLLSLTKFERQTTCVAVFCVVAILKSQVFYGSREHFFKIINAGSNSSSSE